jgi:hypothetical protein
VQVSFGGIECRQRTAEISSTSLSLSLSNNDSPDPASYAMEGLESDMTAQRLTSRPNERVARHCHRIHFQ